MYLRELRINGFKSFADPTRVDLRPGVTAIVGPNGCGKSNIADAIRWVLGEQSAKSLRAGAMQDVIFQGTTGRKPLNLCEVSLVFTDCEQQLGTAFKEVEVGRRVVRDGGSEYLINGKSCRLKDIQRLFLDTGVGQVSYSFMLQGQIDAILSTNPAERRTIFEEAAGISRYKAQRREAMNKLVGVDTNLARVTDVMEEVGRQIGSLRRQATKAIRYKRLKQRLTHLDLAAAAFKASHLRKDVADASAKLDFLRTEALRLRRELDEAGHALTSKRNQRVDLNERLQSAQQSVYALRSEKENALQRAEFTLVRGADMRNRMQTIQEEIGGLRQRQHDLAERLAGQARSKQQQLDLFDTSDDLFKRKSDELVALQETISKIEGGLALTRQNLLLKESAMTRARSNCTTLEVDLKSFQMVHANLLESIHLLREEALVLERDAAELHNIHAARIEARSVQEARLTDTREMAQRLTAQFREVQTRIQETDRANAKVQAQIQVLEAMQQKLEGFAEGSKALLQGQLATIIATTDYSVLLRSIQVQPRWTEAIEALLGSALEGIFIRNPHRAAPLRDALIAGDLGRACLHLPPHEGLGTPVFHTPEGLIPARSVVSSKDTAICQFLDHMLAGCFCCEELGPFLQLWQHQPHMAFRWVASADGELADWRGTVWIGLRKGKKDSTFLGRAREIEVLQQQKERLSGQHEQLRMQAAQVQHSMDRNQEQMEEIRALIAELSHEVSTLQAQMAAARTNATNQVRALDSKERELDGLERKREESQMRLERAQAELRAAEADAEQRKTEISVIEERLSSAQKQRDELRESFNEVRLEMAEKRQRLEILDRGLAELEQQAKEVELLSIRRRQELDTLGEQLEGLTQEREVQQERAARIDETLQTTMAGLEKDRTALLALEKIIEEVEAGIAVRRNQNDAITAEIHKVEVHLTRQQSQLQYISDEITRDYHTDVARVNWPVELWKAGDAVPERIRVDFDEETDEESFTLDERGDPSEEDLKAMPDAEWHVIEEEIKALRGRISSMGAVNLVAIEEYKNLKERHAFLKEQSDDLWKAKEQLLSAINEINATSQQLFAQTFDQIRKNFTYTFETLFGGGTADLKLIDSEDVLESGIEIIAQPPGTRLKTLALLSGGQRTMTAVGLLFAIYMVKPSPFCVLDEIDAPLDDANIGRFCTMVERFLEFSQFVIITHNKRTIASADTLYGVTMQEKGVSRLVSMRFNRNTGEATAANQ